MKNWMRQVNIGTYYYHQNVFRHETMHWRIRSLVLLPLISSQTTCVSWSSIRIKASSFSRCMIKFPGPGSSTLTVAIPLLCRLCKRLDILIFPNKYCPGYLSLADFWAKDGEDSFRCLLGAGPPSPTKLSNSSKWYLLFVTFNFPVSVASVIPGLTSTGFSLVARPGARVIRSNLLLRGR